MIKIRKCHAKLDFNYLKKKKKFFWLVHFNLFPFKIGAGRHQRGSAKFSSKATCMVEYLETEIIKTYIFKLKNLRNAIISCHTSLIIRSRARVGESHGQQGRSWSKLKMWTDSFMAQLDNLAWSSWHFEEKKGRKVGPEVQYRDSPNLVDHHWWRSEQD